MKHIDDVLFRMENNDLQDRNQAYSFLRPLGMNDFSYVQWNMPDQRFPKVSSLLPAMASEEMQKLWTGFHGYPLLVQSINFMRAIAANYSDITGKSLGGKKILDYGCGYGRLLRLSAFYSEYVYGVDPWPESLRACNDSGIDDIQLSDYLPVDLPVPDDIDFTYAFSVFTHLSQKSTIKALTAIHRHTAPEGILCITIRPIEYWRTVYGSTWTEDQLKDIENQHEEGFAFYSHNWVAHGTDEVTYGDTSITLTHLKMLCDEIGWSIQGLDRSMDDPVQRYVFLRKA